MEYAVAEVRLCGIVMGVEATIRTGRDVFRVVAPIEALRDRGADPSEVKTWLSTFQANEAEIVAAALNLRASVGGAVIIVPDLVAPPVVCQPC